VCPPNWGDNVDVAAKQVLAAKKLAKQELSAEPKLAAQQILAAKRLIAADIAAEAEAAYGVPLTDDELKQINALFEEAPRKQVNTKLAKPVLAAVKLAKRELSAEPKLAAEQLRAAESLIAGVDAADAAAEKRGYPLTDEELKQLGYVEEEGGCWGLPISVSICKVLVEEEQQKKKNA
jgi:hypothetical protein